LIARKKNGASSPKALKEWAFGNNPVGNQNWRAEKSSIDFSPSRNHPSKPKTLMK
jgi:hypothetical protein